MATYKCDICEREQDKSLNLFLNEKVLTSLPGWTYNAIVQR